MRMKLIALALVVGALAHAQPAGAQEEDFLSEEYLCSLYTPEQLALTPWCAASLPATPPPAVMKAPAPAPAPTPVSRPAPPAPKPFPDFIPSADNALGAKLWKRMSDGGSLRQTPESAMRVIAGTDTAKAIGFAARYQSRAVAALSDHEKSCKRTQLRRGTILSALSFVLAGQDRAWGTTRVEFDPVVDGAWMCDLGNGVYVGRFDGCGNFFLVVSRIITPPSVVRASTTCERFVVLNVWAHTALPTDLQELVRSVGATERGFGFDRGTTAFPRAVSATLGPQLRARGTRWTGSASTFMVTLRQVLGDPATSWDEGAPVRSFTVTVPAGEALQLPITETEIAQYAIDVRPTFGRFVYPRTAVVAFPREWRQCQPGDTFGRLHIHTDREA